MLTIWIRGFPAVIRCCSAFMRSLFPRVVRLLVLSSFGTCSFFLSPCSRFLPPCSLFLPPCSLFLPPCSLFLPPCSPFLPPCSLFLLPCSLFLPPALFSFPPALFFLPPCSLFLPPCSLFLPPCSLFLLPCSRLLPDSCAQSTAEGERCVVNSLGGECVGAGVDPAPASAAQGGSSPPTPPPPGIAAPAPAAPALTASLANTPHATPPAAVAPGGAAAAAAAGVGNGEWGVPPTSGAHQHMVAQGTVQQGAVLHQAVQNGSPRNPSCSEPSFAADPSSVSLAAAPSATCVSPPPDFVVASALYATQLTAPTCSPVSSPAAKPATCPVTSPVSNPVTSPVSNRVSSPVSNPVTSPVRNPATKLVTSRVAPGHVGAASTGQQQGALIGGAASAQLMASLTAAPAVGPGAVASTGTKLSPARAVGAGAAGSSAQHPAVAAVGAGGGGGGGGAAESASQLSEALAAAAAGGGAGTGGAAGAQLSAALAAAGGSSAQLSAALAGLTGTGRGAASNEPRLRDVLSDPLTGRLLDDAVVGCCGHSFGGATLAVVRESSTCPECGAHIDAATLTPNLTLRAAVAAFRRESSSLAAAAMAAAAAAAAQFHLLSLTPPCFPPLFLLPSSTPPIQPVPQLSADTPTHAHHHASSASQHSPSLSFAVAAAAAAATAAGSPPAVPMGGRGGASLLASFAASASPTASKPAAPLQTLPGPARTSYAAPGSVTAASLRASAEAPQPGTQQPAHPAPVRPVRSSSTAQFPFRVNDVVLIKGNKRTPEHFIGRKAIITTQCLNGWYMVRTLDGAADEVRLQYRSLEKIHAAAAAGGGGAGGSGGGGGADGVGAGGVAGGGSVVTGGGGGVGAGGEEGWVEARGRVIGCCRQLGCPRGEGEGMVERAGRPNPVSAALLCSVCIGGFASLGRLMWLSVAMLAKLAESFCTAPSPGCSSFLGEIFVTTYLICLTCCSLHTSIPAPTPLPSPLPLSNPTFPLFSNPSTCFKEPFIPLPQHPPPGPLPTHLFPPRPFQLSSSSRPVCVPACQLSTWSPPSRGSGAGQGRPGGGEGGNKCIAHQHASVTLRQSLHAQRVPLDRLSMPSASFWTSASLSSSTRPLPVLLPLFCLFLLPVYLVPPVLPLLSPLPNPPATPVFARSALPRSVAGSAAASDAAGGASRSVSVSGDFGMCSGPAGEVEQGAMSTTPRSGTSHHVNAPSRHAVCPPQLINGSTEHGGLSDGQQRAHHAASIGHAAMPVPASPGSAVPASPGRGYAAERTDPGGGSVAAGAAGVAGGRGGELISGRILDSGRSGAGGGVAAGTGGKQGRGIP
ncbi:unnamed protein product [Closterium sp. NIES-65]|nr:unnamed protein product [Closterium sp. NIES-65]